MYVVHALNLHMDFGDDGSGGAGGTLPIPIIRTVLISGGLYCSFSLLHYIRTV